MDYGSGMAKGKEWRRVAVLEVLPPRRENFRILRRSERTEGMAVFEEYREELERCEQMYGKDRGRLAVSLDRITNALVLVGQHGVYCTSQRNPALPVMDVRIISLELENAKELIQAVMEELKKARQNAQKVLAEPKAE